MNSAPEGIPRFFELLVDIQAIRTCSASMVSSKVRQRESKPFRPTRHRPI